MGSYGARVYAGTPSGLLAFHRIIYPTKMSLKVEHAWIPPAGGEVRLSGNLTSLEKGLPFESLKILFNGVEIGSCRTDAFGGYDCTIRWPEARAETVNLTLLYPGDPCYEASRASRMFHLVNVTTAYGSAMGAGWYEEGGRATIRVIETVVREGFTEYTFKGWRIQGTIVSSEPALTITVEKPVKVEAVWEQRLTALAIAIIAVAVASLLLAAMLIVKEKRGKSSSVQRKLSEPLLSISTSLWPRRYLLSRTFNDSFLELLVLLLRYQAFIQQPLQLEQLVRYRGF
ncbi:MAG: hypothetical protein QXX12_06705 [Nanopusillaceae archaeon]